MLPEWLYALRHPLRARRALQLGHGLRPRFVYTLWDVAAMGPAGNVINYLDRRAIRGMLTKIGPMQRAAEIGAGYGRLTMVLGESADEVMAFEREPLLVELGRELLPDVGFVQVDSLTRLPMENEAVDLALTFTVLQHIPGQQYTCVTPLGGSDSGGDDEGDKPLSRDGS